MATRLQKAIEELNRCLGARPYCLVFQQSHTDARAPVVSIVSPTKQPFWITRGLLLEGIDAALELSQGRTDQSVTYHKPEQENDDDESAGERGR